MTAEYLVNIGFTQLYLDEKLKRCAPPGTALLEAPHISHYVRVEKDGLLLTKAWDVGLAEFSETQRARAELYKSPKTEVAGARTTGGW